MKHYPDIALAVRFFKLLVYQHLRQTAVAKEQQISFKLDRLTFNGVIDLVGNDWVLDYKSDRNIQPLDHLTPRQDSTLLLKVI